MRFRPQRALRTIMAGHSPFWSDGGGSRVSAAENYRIQRLPHFMETIAYAVVSTALRSSCGQ